MRSLDQIKGNDEKQFVQMVLDFSKRAQQQNRAFFTHFYNREWMQSLITTYIAPNANLQFYFYGGYEEAERQILAISPYEPDENEYGIGALSLEVKTGIGKALSHRDYLGSLMNLGLDRRVIGDIILNESGAYVLMEQNIMPYIRSQMISIGRYHNVTVEEMALENLVLASPKTKEMNVTVRALRMDAVCSAAFGLSRNECTKYIQGEKARCNGLLVSASEHVKQGDVLTLRGFGKARLKSVNGRTKKDRVHITIEKYI